MASPVTIPDFGGLHDPFMKRDWSCKAIHEFIVGHLYAHWTYDQAVSYFQWVYKDLLEVTSEELQRVWLVTIPQLPHIEYWMNNKSIDSPEVKQTLATMKVEWNMWRDLGEEGIMKELGEE